LGLLAVATWQNYTDVETRVGEEAAAVGVLYRDVSGFPDPPRTELQRDLRAYTREVINVAWALQRQGIVPETEGVILSEFEVHLIGFEPETEGQKALYTEACTTFNRLAELRGRRLQSVHEGLAGPLWTVVFAGAFLSIALTWFFDMKSPGMNFWMTVMLSALLGLLIFLLGALDNPFRGEISVGPESLRTYVPKTNAAREMIARGQTALKTNDEENLRIRQAGLRCANLRNILIRNCRSNEAPAMTTRLCNYFEVRAYFEKEHPGRALTPRHINAPSDYWRPENPGRLISKCRDAELRKHQ
jgi:hypothetical protein